MALQINISSININHGNAQEHPQHLDKEKARELFPLYHKFLDQNLADPARIKWMGGDFVSVEACGFAWQDLNVPMPITEIQDILMRTGVLQLRPIPEDCRILVIGCGNEPIADGGSYPLAPKAATSEDDQQLLISPKESEEYRRVHAHRNAITMNPHLAHNPTLVSYFGTQHYPMLKTGQFDLIVIEGTKISDTPIGRDELNRILSATGRVVLNYGDKKGLEFSWEENNDLHTMESDHVDPPVVIEDLNFYESFNYPNQTN